MKDHIWKRVLEGIRSSDGRLPGPAGPALSAGGKRMEGPLPGGAGAEHRRRPPRSAAGGPLAVEVVAPPPEALAEVLRRLVETWLRLSRELPPRKAAEEDGGR